MAGEARNHFAFPQLGTQPAPAAFVLHWQRPGFLGFAVSGLPLFPLFSPESAFTVCPRPELLHPFKPKLPSQSTRLSSFVPLRLNAAGSVVSLVDRRSLRFRDEGQYQKEMRQKALALWLAPVTDLGRNTRIGQQSIEDGGQEEHYQDHVKGSLRKQSHWDAPWPFFVNRTLSSVGEDGARRAATGHRCGR